ncbi:Olfactory receptor 7A17 [Sciurus carolinensis]|uniref:Olfactory receptor 7A17 n=1 Tax=Sciurus carolinensis TaxID=30640 RepID=A0AA41MPB8_SCICA|nr:Olfactory receptor 7A17 [Sciurus carolinensis]
MSFFLSNLSFSDTCFTSTTIPKMLVDIQTQSKAITYAGCSTQICFFTVFRHLYEFTSVMACDCFVAICCPLYYTVLMRPWLCAQLLLLNWS